MNNPHVVQITQAIGERSDDLIRLQLAQNRSSADITVQLAASQKLHHDVHMLRVKLCKRSQYVRGLEGFDESDDVGMLHQRQIRDFRLDQLRFLLRQLRFRDHFHRVLLPRFLLDALHVTTTQRLPSYAVHLRETPLADLLAQVVEVAEAPHARRLLDRLHPARSVGFRRGVEGLVVCRGELQSEAEVLRVLGVGHSILKGGVDAHICTVALSKKKAMLGTSAAGVLNKYKKWFCSRA